MSTSFNKKELLSPSVAWSIRLLGIFLLVYGLIAASSLLIPLAFAFIFSLSLYPLVVYLEKRGWWRSLAIFAGLFIILLVLLLIFFIIFENILSFSAELTQIKKQITEIVEKSRYWLEHTLQMPASKQLEWIKQNSNDFLGFLGNFLNSFITSTANFIAQTILVLIYVYFMLFNLQIST
jgi:predicted PurR-regulated permease PerM